MRIVNEQEATINVNNVTTDQYIVAMISGIPYRVLKDNNGIWLCCNINKSELSYALEINGCNNLQSYIKYVMGFGEVYAFNTRKEARNFTNTL